MKDMLKRVVVAIITYEAKLLLTRKRPKIIAVTGSVGKTTTKDSIYSVLKGNVHARKSQKSFNSEIGVPLSILGLENGWNNPWLWLKNIFDGAFLAFFAQDYPAVLVLEAGVDRPGDMATLAQWLRPDIVVLTRFPDVPVHVEYFGSPAAIVAEKMHLVQALKTDGVVVYNADDASIGQALTNITQRKIGYGYNATANLRLSGAKARYVSGKPVGIDAQLNTPEGTITLSLSGTLGVAPLLSASAAVAVGTLFDISLETAAAALAAQTSVPGRLRLVAGVSDSTIIDDTYNASPVAMQGALETLNGLTVGGRKVAVLGDMLELGRFSVAEHERVGTLVASVATVLVTVGVRAHKIAEAAKQTGFSDKQIYSFDSSEQAAPALIKLVEPGDVILVKASQGIRAEKIVKSLMARPDEARETLVRQETMWERR